MSIKQAGREHYMLAAGLSVYIKLRNRKNCCGEGKSAFPSPVLTDLTVVIFPIVGRGGWLIFLVGIYHVFF